MMSVSLCRSTGRSGLPRFLILPAAVVAALIGLLAPAAQAYAAEPIVKYYVVTEADTRSPEALATISERFLGRTDLVSDIMALNKGRTQPDGGTLTDPDVLHAGWLIILPWDAIGPGVIMGVLPAGTAQPGAEGANCAGVQPATARSDTNWAQLRLAPEQAWTHGRGKGVTVAIVDSGVDASVPALSGRVTNGADVVTGSGRGDVDCLGTGTGMAGLIVSQPGQGSAIAGLAPDAAIMPVRVVTNSTDAPVADEAAAIDVAVSAGVTVIAIGSYVDVGQTEVLAAIARATQHDVLVVVGATTTSAMPPIDGVVRVGAMGIDNQLAESYAEGGVDVVAPGVGVTTLGIKGTGNLSGTGTQYAVALVAAQAALIRSAEPTATAAETAQRIRSTATALVHGKRPDPHSGWGLINLAASVQPAPAVPPSTAAAPPPRNSGVSTGVVWVIVAIAIVILVLLISRIRRAIRSGGPGAYDEDDPDGPVPPDPHNPHWPGQPTGPGGLPRRQQGRSGILRFGRDRHGPSPSADTTEVLTSAATGAGPGARAGESDRPGTYGVAPGGADRRPADPRPADSEWGTTSTYGTAHGRRP